MDEYNRHQAGGRYEVKLSSNFVYPKMDEIDVASKTVSPSTKAGSRSAKTFMGIVDAKQVARAITIL